MLDLDETLIHANTKELDNIDFKLNLTIENEELQLNVSKRPYLKRFLEKVAKYYEVVFYTASIQEVLSYFIKLF